MAAPAARVDAVEARVEGGQDGIERVAQAMVALTEDLVELRGRLGQ